MQKWDNRANDTILSPKYKTRFKLSHIHGPMKRYTSAICLKRSVERATGHYPACQVSDMTLTQWCTVNRGRSSALVAVSHLDYESETMKTLFTSPPFPSMANAIIVPKLLAHEETDSDKTTTDRTQSWLPSYVLTRVRVVTIKGRIMNG